MHVCRAWPLWDTLRVDDAGLILTTMATSEEDVRTTGSTVSAMQEDGMRRRRPANADAEY